MSLTRLSLTEIADPTTATPAEIDTVLEHLEGIASRLRIERSRAVDSLHRALGHKGSYRRGVTSFEESLAATLAEAYAIVTAYAATDLDSPVDYTAKRITEDVNVYEFIAADLAANEALQQPLHAEYEARGRWSRAFVVLNTNGHIHSSRSCHTCFWNTPFGWLPQASGLAEETIVDAAGEAACTVCYPSAPVDVLKRERARWLLHSTEEAAVVEREARAAEKAAKQAKKIADGLTADGSPLSFRWFDYTTASGRDIYKHVEFKTERAASQALVSSRCDVLNGYARSALPADVDKAIVDALAAKHGATTESVEVQIAAKVAAKQKRDGRY